MGVSIPPSSRTLTGVREPVNAPESRPAIWSALFLPIVSAGPVAGRPAASPHVRDPMTAAGQVAAPGENRAAWRSLITRHLGRSKGNSEPE